MRLHLTEEMEPFMRLCCRFLVFLVSICALFGGAGTARAQQELPRALQFLVPYGGLLNDFTTPMSIRQINTRAVDYASWQTDPRHEEAMRLLYASDPESLRDDNEKKAFWLNAYNLLTIDLVIKQNVQNSIKQLAGWFSSPWKDYTWPIANKPYTLDDIEHKILRPMGDARVHMALNCAAISCPNLRNEPYLPARLDAQLDEQVQDFLTDPSKGLKPVDIGNDEYAASEIFKWYKDDFNKGDPESWIAEQLGYEDVGIESFIDYNWTLNAVPGRAPAKN